MCVGSFAFAQNDSAIIPSTQTLQVADSQKINKQKDTQQVVVPAIKDSFETSIDTSNIFLADSLRNDSIKKIAAIIISKPLTWQQDTAFRKLLKISVTKNQLQNTLHNGDVRSVANMDILFYAILALVLFIAFIKYAFPKYFYSLFTMLGQPSFRQKQTREQLLQNNLPSLMMNLFFILTAGLFIALVAQKNYWVSLPFWIVALYCTVVLGLVYLIKFIVITFAGWVFNSKEAATTYSFIVFLINKIVGIILLPLLVLVAFSSEQIKNVSITLAACVAVFLLLYRYAISLTVIRRNLKVSAFHFFIYLCAVEIMPMLVIYKVLFSQTGKVVFYH